MQVTSRASVKRKVFKLLRSGLPEPVYQHLRSILKVDHQYMLTDSDCVGKVRLMMPALAHLLNHHMPDLLDMGHGRMALYRYMPSDIRFSRIEQPGAVELLQVPKIRSLFLEVLDGEGACAGWDPVVYTESVQPLFGWSVTSDIPFSPNKDANGDATATSHRAAFAMRPIRPMNVACYVGKLHSRRSLYFNDGVLLQGAIGDYKHFLDKVTTEFDDLPDFGDEAKVVILPNTQLAYQWVHRLPAVVQGRLVIMDYKVREDGEPLPAFARLPPGMTHMPLSSCFLADAKNIDREDRAWLKKAGIFDTLGVK